MRVVRVLEDTRVPLGGEKVIRQAWGTDRYARQWLCVAAVSEMTEGDVFLTAVRFFKQSACGGRCGRWLENQTRIKWAAWGW